MPHERRPRTVPVTLTFEKVGEVDYVLAVGTAAATLTPGAAIIATGLRYLTGSTPKWAGWGNTGAALDGRDHGIVFIVG
ncbi:hypothetical protein HR059_06705 [Sinorhizobium meliloti WSM1022]|jgi:hypothetical protein|uniref:hypothetical protein n=1 Tax=Rhizobium meliloti TaxID=382 RepID=UPI0004869048|nr:hypothetical protein [Sinorhizobium meliloti]ASQ04148.1 hypothetical protein CDO23_09505 [Sinorhizobium meliloti]MCO6422968.1 hypothetical protein [Sinorhizobium meliloti]MDW9409646.1 hypothetical protein [Sinorhizobium meliloti]MDW9441061.1 hypothetical protein [Sinorhizobium meliloti]MDW9454892.1 hypothetical protein [Sinorhizobium meliloti]